MEVVSSFKYLGSCFSKDEGPHEDVKMTVGEGLKTFGALNMMFTVRSVSFGAKRQLYERVVVPTVPYGAVPFDMVMNETDKLDVMEIKCSRSNCGVIRMDR